MFFYGDKGFALHPKFLRLLLYLHLSGRFIFQQCVNLGGIKHIVEGQAIVVIYNSLRGRFAAWVAACQDLTDFIVVVKLRKVFEALHMVRCRRRKRGRTWCRTLANPACGRESR